MLYRLKGAQPIRGYVDSPAAGAELLTAVPIAFSGWALEGSEPVACVDIAVVGGQSFAARLGRPRLDVPLALDEPGAPDCSGWDGEIDLSSWPHPEARVRVIARGSAGQEAILSDHSYRLKGAQPIRGYVDSPAAGAELLTAVPIAFSGWALEGSEPVACVDIAVVGGQSFAARLGRPRLDVPLALDEPGAPDCSGWDGEIDLSSWPHPEARVRVIARGSAGQEAILSDRSYRLKAHERVGSFDTPAELLGTVLTVRGQALVNGRCPAAVDIAVDGKCVGRARLRLPVAASGASDSRALFAGFEHTIVLEDDRSPTIHTIDARVSDATGQSFDIGEHTVRVRRRRVSRTEAREAALLRARTRSAVDPGVRTVPLPCRSGRHRVLVFAHQLDLGGGQLYLQELLRQLAPVSESCTVVSPSDGELRSELELLGISVIVTGMVAPTDIATYEGQVREHSMLIIDSGCQVVLVNTLADFVAVDAAARLGVPTVWAIHESFEVDHWLEQRFGRGGPHPYVSERMKTSLAAATRLVFESQATSDMFACATSGGRRLVIPYGVDVDGITDFMSGFDRAGRRSREALGPDSTVLLCVGTVEERKSQACLVEAFAEVATEYPDATLALVGDRPGLYSTALHRLIESLGLGERVRLLPITRDIWDWYALSDVLVSASDIESLPRSMLEAMAFGLPVMSAAVHGIPELVRDNENGWLFEPRDMRALVVALRRVLDVGAEARRNMGVRARTDVSERHRSTEYARSYAALFRELTADGSAMSDAAHPSSATDAGPAGTWEAVRPYTMTSSQRVAALCDAIRYISAHGIRGDIVECGVWKGGSALAAARTLLECVDVERTLWLYDTFSGMTPPEDVDRRLGDGVQAAAILRDSTRGADIWAVADLDEVKRTMSLCGYPDDKIRYVVGPVERTLPESMPEEIALLRLDTDWYASTRHELVHLFPRLSAGGILIIDDYGDWEGAHKAVDEYLASIKKPVFLARIDDSGRIAVVPG